MNVAELIEILEGMDPEAEVLIGSQENWPFEYSLAGVTSREEMLAAEADSDEEPSYENGTAGSDVFLVEGQQLRYGSKLMWSAARR